MDEVPSGVRLSLEVDGFTAVLPPHWLAAALLRFLREISAMTGFVLGTVVAALVAGAGLLLGLALLAELLPQPEDAFLGVAVVPFVLVFVGCLGASWGQRLVQRLFAAAEAQILARQRPLRLQGRQLILGPRRIPLAEVVSVEVRGWSVVLRLHSGARQTLCAPAGAGVRVWLAELLGAVLVLRSVGAPEDVPEALRAIQQGTAQRGETPGG